MTTHIYAVVAVIDACILTLLQSNSEAVMESGPTGYPWSMVDAMHKRIDGFN